MTRAVSLRCLAWGFALSAVLWVMLSGGVWAIAGMVTPC